MLVLQSCSEQRYIVFEVHNIMVTVKITAIVLSANELYEIAITSSFKDENSVSAANSRIVVRGFRWRANSYPPLHAINIGSVWSWPMYSYMCNNIVARQYDCHHEINIFWASWLVGYSNLQRGSQSLFVFLMRVGRAGSYGTLTSAVPHCNILPVEGSVNSCNILPVPGTVNRL